MAAWVVLLLMAAVGGAVLGSNCPPPCPVCPDVVPCPTPSCPVPKCPPLPDIPPCPVPRCPSLPEIPTCPNPVLNLSCPNVTCPPQSCPPCPSCPDSPSCPPCSNASVPVSRPIPAGYERVDGVGVYKFFTHEVGWQTANVTCARDGAYLAVPDSQNELSMLLRMMSVRRERFLHVGFIKSNWLTNFSTILGQPMTAEQKNLWASGEPDASRVPNCVYLSQMYGALADEGCTDLEPFVCEFPA